MSENKFLGIRCHQKVIQMNIVEKKIEMEENLNFFRNQPRSIDLARFETISANLQSLQLGLQRLSNAKKTVSLQFMSSIRGEGTSTIASHFAVLVAQSQIHRRNPSRKPEKSRVLLIDANFRNPSLHQIFGISNSVGLSNLLNEEKDFSEVITSFSDLELDLLPTGSQIENPTKLLKGDSLKKLLTRVDAMYSWIVIDSAPIVPFSDALAFTDYVDGSILIVEAGQTRREVVESARKKIELSGMKVQGVVLSKRQYHIPKIIYNRL
jgi:capsular exopolysaccharide synthesis family protein